MTALYLSKCLKQIKNTKSLHTCSPVYELPSNTSTLAVSTWMRFLTAFKSVSAANNGSDHTSLPSAGLVVSWLELPRLPLLDGNSEMGAHVRCAVFFYLLTVTNLYFFLQKRPIFRHMSPTCSNLPSDISTMENLPRIIAHYSSTQSEKGSCCCLRLRQWIHCESTFASRISYCLKIIFFEISALYVQDVF